MNPQGSEPYLGFQQPNPQMQMMQQMQAMQMMPSAMPPMAMQPQFQQMPPQMPVMNPMMQHMQMKNQMLVQNPQFNQFMPQNAGPMRPQTQAPRPLVRKQSAQNLPMYPNPQVPAPQKKRQKTKMPVVAQPTAPAPVLQRSQSNVVPPFMGQGQILIKALSMLNDERLDLFCRLFECAKRKEERIDYFVTQVYPRLVQANPNYGSFLPLVIEKIKLSGDPGNRFWDVHTPPVFWKPRTIKPVYKLVALNMNGIEIAIPQRERKGELFVVGSFLTVGETAPTGMIVTEHREVSAVNYGTAENFYLIMGENRGAQKLLVHLPKVPSPDRTWFVVQYLEMKPEMDVFKEYTSQLKGANEHNVYARTSACKDCSFLFINVIRELRRCGSSKCPKCGARILLTDLSFSVGQAQEPAPYAFTASESKIEEEIDTEDAELHQARLVMADHLARVYKVSCKGLYGAGLYAPPMCDEEDDLDCQCPEDLSFSTREDFIKLIHGALE